MGANLIPTRADGQPMNASWWNALLSALAGSIVPRRQADGVPENEAETLGTATYPWQRCYRTVAPPAIGQIKIKYDYNGTVKPDHGWMLCDGRQITQAAYDTEHYGDLDYGGGDDITSSPLYGKYLPNYNDKYIGAKPAQATQSGAAPITSEGSNTQNLQHNDHGYDPISSPASSNVATGALYPNITVTGYQHVHTMQSEGSALSASQNLRPESLQAKVYMRVI